MKIYFLKYFPKSLVFFVFFISLIISKSDFLYSQEQYIKDIQKDSSTKSDDSSSDLPTNPFEIVRMIRRANSMNDATKPSDALDEALKLFNIDEVKEKN